LLGSRRRAFEVHNPPLGHVGSVSLAIGTVTLGLGTVLGSLGALIRDRQLLAQRRQQKFDGFLHCTEYVRRRVRAFNIEQSWLTCTRVEAGLYAVCAAMDAVRGLSRPV